MKKSIHPDPFENKRESDGFGFMDDQNDPVTMILKLKDVRKCAHMWESFHSEDKPGRIVIPSEVSIRDIRQIPFELDPPLHTSFRKLLDPWFKRPSEEGYRSAIKALVETEIDRVIELGEFDMIMDLALPLQSRALTLLLDVPLDEAETWISWGTHVFRSEDDPLDKSKANILYDYLDNAIETAEEKPGNDLYSKLLSSSVDGRKLTKEEIKGIMVLTFAGGRDTVINALSNTVAYLSEHPEILTRLRTEPEVRGRAVEELLRYFSPLTQIGRVSSKDEVICEHAIKADSRISLCWASANRDASTFENPNKIIIDRKMNPHVSFGFGRHKCLGAHHARALLETFISVFSEKVRHVEIMEMEENIEELGEFNRKVGYHKLRVKISA